MKLLKVKKLVEQALEQYEPARNDDRLLVFIILHKIKYPNWPCACGFKNLMVRLKDLKKFPSFEAIIRARAKIQNVEKRFLPTDETVRRRREQQKKYRAFVTGESS
jgi:hypothetical protein